MKKSASLQARFSRFMISLLFVLTIALSVSGTEEALAATTKAPSKVTLSSAKASAYNKVTVSWKKASNVTSYNVYYKESGATKWTKIANVGKSKTSYTHTSSTKYKLTPGKTYYYTVRGYNSSSKKSGSYNTTGLKVTIPGKPSKVTLSSVTASSDNSVTVKWKKATNATEYRVYYKVSEAKSWTKIATVSSSKTSYTHTSSTKYPLTAGKTYYYTVRAYNKKAASLSSYNTTGLAVTMPATPAKVTVNSAMSIDSDKVLVAWKAAESATNYRIYYKEKGASSWTKIATVKSGTTTYTHTSSTKYPLTAGKTYYYTVRGYNSTSKKLGSYDKTGKSVTIPVATTTTVSLAKVTLKSVSMLYEDTAQVTWNAVSGATHYYVYYKESGTSNWSKIATVDSSQTSYTHASTSTYPLEEGNTYYFTVRAYDSVSKTLGSYDTTGVSVKVPVTVYDSSTVKMYTESEIQAMIDEVFKLTNEERVANGKKSLTYINEAQKVSMLRAKEIATKFSHSRPDGTSFGTAYTECGIYSNGGGENIAAGQTSAKEVVTDWMNSPGHKVAMLDSCATGISIGLYQREDGVLFWVQNFTYTLDIHRQGTAIFYANGGVFANGESTLTYTLLYNTSIYFKDVPVPTRDGYTFTGWVTNYNETNLVGVTTDNDSICYAQWKENE